MKVRFAQLLIVVTAFGVPLAFLLWVRLGANDIPEALQAAPQAVVLEAVAEDLRDEFNVVVELDWESGSVIAAPDWSGTVTAVYVEQGHTIESGDIVLQVDGIDRRAVSLEAPLYRSLARGSVGQDVGHLQGFLRDLGLYDGDIDGLFGAGLTSAVKAYESGLGIPKPVGVFDPAWTMWTPEPILVTFEIHAEVGHPAPPNGTPVVVGPPRLVAARLVGAAESGFDVPRGSDWVFKYETVEFSITRAELQLSEFAALVAAIDPNTESVEGVVMSTEPLPVTVVSPASVTVGRDGQLCVWVESGDLYAPRSVEVLRTEVGRTLIIAGLQPQTRVLANPAEVLEDSTCR